MSEMNLQLPKEIVESAVRDKISAAIATELGDPAEIISRFVGIALSQKVDDKGKVSRYGSENRYSFLESVAGEMIRSAAKDALKEYISDNEKLIKEAVKKEVCKSQTKIAKVFVSGLIESLDCRYRTNVDIGFSLKGEQLKPLK